MELTFTIRGNHEDPHGNPVPYVRSTRGALWRKDGKRYAEWKQFVRAAFLAVCFQNEKCIPWISKESARELYDLSIKPIDTRQFWEARMNLMIYWRNRAHGDPDNIWKGIADALFADDRNLNGGFESAVAPDGKGKVEITIKITSK